MKYPLIYLASSSPRRQELLRQIGVNFDVLNRPVDEAVLPAELPGKYVQRIAQAKAAAGYQLMIDKALPAGPVLAADTSVVVDEQILGKPQSQQQASEFLRLLSGKTHQVLTAVVLKSDQGVDTTIQKNTVTFAELSDNDIAAYIAIGESLDKAGGYAVQGTAAQFIARIEGSYSGIMGLPLFETRQLLLTYMSRYE